jgi:hypothetical protein
MDPFTLGLPQSDTGKAVQDRQNRTARLGLPDRTAWKGLPDKAAKTGMPRQESPDGLLELDRLGPGRKFRTARTE